MKIKLLTLLALHLGLAAVPAQPVITNQPQNQTNVAGTTAKFTVRATGIEPLAYQWRVFYTGIAFTNAPFGNESSLFITNVQPTTTRFAVVVTDAGGLSVTSSPLVKLTVVVPPRLESEPLSQLAEAGDVVAFTAVATGTTPLAYQWRWNDTNLTGKTNANLAFASVQLSNSGAYQVIVSNLYGAATSRVATLTVVPLLFTKITTGSMVTDLGTGTCAAWGDYDNDGFIDLIVTSGFHPSERTPQKNNLFHNNRDGGFTKVTTSPITANARDWRGCSWGDYDNDGNLDLIVSSTDNNGYASANELFRNNGDGTFTKMSAQSAGDLASIPAAGSEGPVWADYDNDGLLDLFIARYGPDWLFHNNGDGTFTRTTNGNVGLIEDIENSYTAVWSDYDNDGYPDIFVTSEYDIGTAPFNFFYRNKGNGSFARMLGINAATDDVHSVGCGWADYDNDGYMDLFVVNGLNFLETCSLYHNDGNGALVKVDRNTAGSIVSDVAYFTQCTWGDYDNDGFIDVFVAAVGSATTEGTNYLYHNNGDGSFAHVPNRTLGADLGVGVGSAWGDYDNDGFLDLFVARGTEAVVSQNLLYHNCGNSNAWIKIKLIGTISNRSAVGAKIRVQADIRGRSVWQMREINTGNGFCASPLEAHFGLGDATNIDAVRIEWPSGIVQELHDVNPRQFLTIAEPPRLIASMTNGELQFSIKGRRSSSYQVDTSADLTIWSSLGAITITNQNGIARIIDTNRTEIDQKFYRAVSR